MEFRIRFLHVFFTCIIFVMNKIAAEPVMECNTSRLQSFKLSDSEYCNVYYECVKGNLTEKVCSSGYVFSDTEDDCVEVISGSNCTRKNVSVSAPLPKTTTRLLTSSSNVGPRPSCKVFGICSQQCNDTGTTVSCSCIEGFKLEKRDNKTCSLIESNWKLLYLTNSLVGYTGGRKRAHTIKTMYLQNYVFYTGVTFDARNNYTCWTDATKNYAGVYCSNFNGTNFDIIANSGVGSPQSLALDWVTGNIYFVDWGRKEIIVCRSDINVCSVLVTKLVSSPNDLVIDPNHGFMFWTNRIGNHKIMRADMDGRNLITLLNSDLKIIQGLAIDQGSSRLYWIDPKFDKLESCLLNGNDRRVTTSGKRLFLDAFVIDVFADRVFWADHISSKIMSADKFTGNDVKQHFVNQRNGKLRGGRILHRANQPIKIRNPCEGSPCSHICVISPKSQMQFRCVCPVGMDLESVNERTCIETPNFPKLAISYGNNVYMMTLDSIGKSLMEKISVPGVESIQSMVYNLVSNSLVLRDSNSKVFEFLLDGKVVKNTTTSTIAGIRYMDIDLVAENLYWVNTDLNTLETMSLQTGTAISLLQLGVENITAFSIAPKLGSVLLATTRNDMNFLHKVSLDGKSSAVIRRLKKDTGSIFTIDKHTERIFWFNERSEVFNSLSLTGDEEVVDVGEDNVPNFSLSEHNILYFVPSERVVRVTKYENFIKYTYKLDVQDEEIFRVGPSGRTSIALVNNTISDELWDLRHNNECSSKSIRSRTCSHICVVGEGTHGRCHCPNGVQLGKDNATCMEIEVELNACNDGQFKCNDGKCISSELVCDGVTDCYMGEDEAICKDQLTCPENTFHCGRNDELGMCIPNSWVCDKDVDCVDGSDEFSCRRYSCKETDHYCEETDRCVPKSWICASKYNCPGINPINFCRGYHCSNDKSKPFICANLSRCIAASWFCDGGNDCGDASDEPEEYCQELRQMG